MSAAATASIIFSIGTMIVAVIMVLIVQYLSEQRTVIMNASMVNELKNTISIGTDLGDFLFCTFHAYQSYIPNTKTLETKVEISYINLFKAYSAWSVNNNYSNPNFTLDKYNYKITDSNKISLLDALPNYLLGSGSGYWNLAESFGFELSSNRDTVTLDEAKMFYITKNNNNYIRALLNEEKFENTRVNLTDFISNNNSITDIRIDSLTLYPKYIQYLIIFKVQKLYFDSASLFEAYRSENLKYKGHTYEFNDFYWKLIPDNIITETFKKFF